MTTIEDVTINGDGSQNVFGNTVDRDLIVTQLNFVRGRPSMVMSEAEVNEAVGDYVPALNHEQIIETLHRFHVIALAGSAGCGVKTTAIAAFRELHPTLPIRFFSTGEDDVEEIGAADVRGYLVRAGDEQDSRLLSCLEAVRTSGGFLLVIGTAAEQRRFADFLPVIPVQPPLAEAVYRRLLARRGLGGTGWPSWPRAVELLKGASPGDGRRLADLVEAVCRDGSDEPEYEVERAYLGWAEQLRDWFGEHTDLLDRTLMIAAATITPAHETSVYGAALLLARRLEVALAGGGLAWHPSTGLSELLSADRENDQIVFRRHGYAASVLRHVCVEYPLARTDLLSWLSTLPTDTVVALEPALRHKIVEVFADLAADYDVPEKILQMARSWADGRQQAADLAFVALARTCLHPHVGGRVRRKLWEWSRERQAPQTLKLTVVRVCEVLGQTYLPIALTRLKHLATYGDDQVQDEVLEVARSLAEINPATVFAAALTWCQSVAQISGQYGIRRLRTGLRLLLDLLPGRGPVGLQNMLATIEQLVAQGDPQLHPLLLEAMRTLAADHRSVVRGTALRWARSESSSLNETAMRRAMMGTQLFLSLAVEQDDIGLALTLTAPDAVDPIDCTPAWYVALTAKPTPGRIFIQFQDAVRLWLDTAFARPDLRPEIVSSLVIAARGNLQHSQLIVQLVRQWAGTSPERRHVKEEVFLRLLHPEWQRLLLILWVWLRTIFESRETARRA